MVTLAAEEGRGDHRAARIVRGDVPAEEDPCPTRLARDVRRHASTLRWREPTARHGSDRRGRPVVLDRRDAEPRLGTLDPSRATPERLRPANDRASAAIDRPARKNLAATAQVYPEQPAHLPAEHESDHERRRALPWPIHRPAADHRLAGHARRHGRCPW